MTDSYLPLLAAMLSAMNANAALTALVGQRIYADVPDNPTLPYVVLTISSAPFDDKTQNGMEHTAQVSIFDRKPSPASVGAIRAAVYNLFHKQESALSSAGVWSIIITGANPTFKEPDGQTWQSVMQFKVNI